MFLKYNLFTVLWAIFILVLTLTPGNAMPQTGSINIPNVDKLAHFLVFGIFAFLLVRGFSKQSDFKTIKKHPIILSVFISVGFGLIIEFIQLVVPGRDFELLDILSNIFGIALGLSMYWLKVK